MIENAAYMGPRVSEQPEPLVPATDRYSCSECEQRIWVALARDPAVIESMRIVCYNCAAEDMYQRMVRGEQVEVLPGKLLDGGGQA